MPRGECLEWGGDPRMRAILCGYEGDHDDLLNHGWRTVIWDAQGAGYTSKGAVREDRRSEVLWLSPHCLAPDSVLDLFG